MLSRRTTILLLSLFAGLAGCSSNSDTTTSTGRISGYIRLLDTGCVAVPSSAGIAVQIVGSELVTTTDATGHWEFADRPAGYYAFSFGKPGYTHQIFSDIAFVGTGVLNVPYNLSLSQLPVNPVTILPPASITKSASPGTDSLWTIVTEAPLVYGTPSFNNFNWFIGRTKHIDYTDSTTYRTFAINISPGSPFRLSAHDFHSNDTIYLAAYQSTCNAPQYIYHDGDLLRYGFTGFGPPSNTVQVVLP